MSLVLGQQVCGNLDAAAAREWLVTDGVGGYAMGTVAGLRTRRYHGLLVPAMNGPSGRMIGLLALDAVLVLGDARVRLSTDEWAGGTVDPQGNQLLAWFALDHGLPVWRWQVGDVVLERTLALAHGRPLVGVVHRLVRADRPVRLELTPLCTWRSVHGERFANGDPGVEATADGFVFEQSFRIAGPGWGGGGSWYRGVRAREEAARGLNDVEDVWAAGTFGQDLAPGESLEVTAAAAPFDGALPGAASVVADAKARAEELWRTAKAQDDVDRTLLLAADTFRISTNGRPTVSAGYPWFGEWSRDLMTSYEGLYLSTGHGDEGREVLRTSAATVSEGMLANTADTGSLQYNTVDGTLWFVHALARHVAVTGDKDLAAELAPVVDQIVQHHVDGTRYGIKADDDGLLREGQDGVALTWMDARVGDTPVTPRIGKPVEVNALWVQALRIAGDARKELADRAAASFAARFPRPDGRGLYDLVDGPGGDDGALRPNQLLAVSLPHGPYEALGDHARAAVDACRGSLLTPIGLRSLSPDDPAYQPYHRGDPWQRDHAYHQGTVWPWLIGPYADAARRVGVPLDGVLEGFEAHLGEWGVGSVSETADGAAPNNGTGCPMQAWSVAEVLRVRRSLAAG